MKTVREIISQAVKHTPWPHTLDEMENNIIVALRDAGYAIVPREPTTDMLLAGAKTWTDEDCGEHEQTIYRAMLSVAAGKEETDDR